jgi:hypothetical protein
MRPNWSSSCRGVEEGRCLEFMFETHPQTISQESDHEVSFDPLIGLKGGHSSIRKKLYAYARNYEENWRKSDFTGL